MTDFPNHAKIGGMRRIKYQLALLLGGLRKDILTAICCGVAVHLTSKYYPVDCLSAPLVAFGAIVLGRGLFWAFYRQPHRVSHETT